MRLEKGVAKLNNTIVWWPSAEAYFPLRYLWSRWNAAENTSLIPSNCDRPDYEQCLIAIGPNDQTNMSFEVLPDDERVPEYFEN